jgi:hypothetical protein
MAQPTEIYVDPSIAGDSGNGAIDNAYGDLEYAIEQTTFDATNGTRVNIKAGTDEVLVAELTVAMANTTTTAAWVPTETAPVVFQGYTTAAGDRGVGGISGGGSVAVITSTTQDFVYFVDLHLHSTGSADILTLDNNNGVIRCELDNTTGSAINFDNANIITECYIHNIGGVGIDVGTSSAILHNYLENGTNDFTSAIVVAVSSSTVVYRNIVKVDGTTDGILVGESCTIMHNSVWSNGGTGQGIRAKGNNISIQIVTNNIVEGFSGTGGIGFDFGTSFGTNVSIRQYGGNASYNNETHFDTVGDYVIDNIGDNEILTSSPFVDAANGNFAPVDTGHVKEGSLPDNFAGQ